MTTPKIEGIIEGFPHPILLKHNGIPTYESIAKTHLKLNANTSSVYLEEGGGLHGLLSLTIFDATYLMLTGHNFNLPSNLRPVPIISAGSTIAVTNEIVRNHRENLRIWREYNATDKALKQQLSGAYDNMYLKTL